MFDVLPNNFIVSFDNNSNLYPVFILNTILLFIVLVLEHFRQLFRVF